MSTPQLDKTYDPKAVEARWYRVWSQKGYFHASPTHPGQPYCIVIPPPNVTGSLHVGHALNNSIQDILIRWRRMQGRNVLWLPGTDHAGIATQNVVERQFMAEGASRESFGREASSSASGNGKPPPGIPSSVNRSGSVSPATGIVIASRWTRVCR